MDILEAVDLVHKEHPGRLPCCVMVARVLAKYADAEDVFKPGTQWWEDANIWNETKPYSSIAAAASVVRHVTGEDPVEQGRVYGARAAAIVADRLDFDEWYVIQGWRSDGTGHTFLLHTDKDSPFGCDIIESSEALGLRAQGGAWYGTKLTQDAEYTPSRLRTYDAGIGYVSLW